MACGFRGRGSAIALLLLLGCAGAAARENVDLPALRLAWPGVAANAEAGIVADLAAAKLTQSAADALRASAKALEASLAAGDHAALAAVPLGALETEAQHGIDAQLAAKTIGAAGAAIMRVRVTNFHAAVGAYLGSS